MLLSRESWHGDRRNAGEPQPVVANNAIHGLDHFVADAVVGDRRDRVRDERFRTRGDDELGDGTVTLRDMTAEKPERLPMAQAIQRIWAMAPGAPR